MNNNYELNKLNLNQFNQYILDKYISFLKTNLKVNNNELLILIDLTTQNKYNNILLSNKNYYENKEYYKKQFIKMFMYNYNKNIKYLKKFIKIDKKNFKELSNFLSNKKRIYSYFENINNKNISFYLTIILNLEYPN